MKTHTLRKAGSLLAMLLIGIAISGCKVRVSYSVHNSGTNQLDGVTVAIPDGHYSELGILVPGSHKSFAGTLRLKGENQVIISWMDEAGRDYQSILTVDKAVLSDQRSLMFRINDQMEVTQGWRFP